jgi:hypothetical protein
MILQGFMILQKIVVRCGRCDLKLQSHCCWRDNENSDVVAQIVVMDLFI